MNQKISILCIKSIHWIIGSKAVRYAVYHANFEHIHWEIDEKEFDHVENERNRASFQFQHEYQLKEAWEK